MSQNPCESGHCDLHWSNLVIRWRTVKSLMKEVLQSAGDLFRWDCWIEEGKWCATINDRRMTVERNPRSRLMFLLGRERRVLNVIRSSETRGSWTGLQCFQSKKSKVTLQAFWGPSPTWRIPLPGWWEHLWKGFHFKEQDEQPLFKVMWKEISDFKP